MTDDIEEEPLDPVMERVRKKMVRLLVISIGIMVIGLMAVLGAIVYKISQPKNPETESARQDVIPRKPAPAGEIVVDLPDGATILSTRFVESRLLVDVRLEDGGREFVIVDLNSGTVSGRVRFR